MTDRLPALRIERHDDDRDIRLVAIGKVDTATAPDLRQRLTEAQRDGESLLLDLDGVEFIDAFGVAVIVEAARRSREHGRRFEVVVSSARIRQVLVDAGVDRLAGLRDEDGER